MLAVAPSDLMRSLPPSLFPGDDAAAYAERLSGYLHEAARLLAGAPDLPAATRDRAAVLWATHRAWADVVARLVATPASVTIEGQGARSTTGEQLRQAAKLRDDALAGYRSLVPDVLAPPAGGGGSSAAGDWSATAPLAYAW